MAFADHYPLEAFLAISHLSWWRATEYDTEISRSHQKAREAGDEDWKAPAELLAGQRAARAADQTDKPLWEAGKDVFQKAVQAHLETLRAEGRLAPTDGVRGRDVWPAKAWNGFVAGKPDGYETRWMINSIADVLTSVFVRMDDTQYARRRENPMSEHVGPTTEQATDAWNRVCALLDAGDSDDLYRILSVECQDGKTGDRCELHFKNWTAVLMRRNEEHRLEIAGNVGPIPLVAASFDVPTGDLLLTDYLRVEGMKEALDLGDEEYGSNYDLNCAEGRANRSAVHAERHRMGYCQTTNTSVTAWQHPDTRAIAIVDRWFGDEADEIDGSTPVAGWTKIGDFSCDMWRVTAVDAQVARELTSAAEVDRYLALREAPIPTKGLTIPEANRIGHDNSYAANIVRVAVEPGRWTMHCGSDFAKRMPRHRYGLPKGVKPWCVITPATDTKPSTKRKAA